MPFIEGGTLLDVGCGSGGALSTMRNKGWKVTGIDFDGDAIAVAKKKGLDARQGDIFSQAFPDETFDAILMSHVIEHVPNPIDVFRECRRILKKNGIIVALTPNAGSLGHNRYARNWRGLETPHHLQLFNPHSLRILAQKSGFKKSTSFSSAQGTQYIIDQSKLLTHRKTMSIYDALPPSLGKWHRLLKEMMWLAHGWIHTIIPYKDEVAVLICRK
jgi:SAM-dependent methyltransferase